MVDLAKIRKKAKKVLSGESTSRPVDESTSVPAAPEASTTRQLDDSTTRLDDSTTRRLDDSTPRRLDDSAPDKLARFKEQAGKRRELVIVRTEEEVAAEAQLELLTFTIAGEQYAVDIERIVEIVTPRPVTRIPNADPSVVGIISLRGTIVTLVDVRRKLRHRGGSDTPDTRIVVIDFRNETVGFVVDRVQRVVKIARNAVEPHPVVHTAELEESIRGVFRVSGALTILLDLDKLLDHTPWT